MNDVSGRVIDTSKGFSITSSNPKGKRVKGEISNEGSKWRTCPPQEDLAVGVSLVRGERFELSNPYGSGS